MHVVCTPLHVAFSNDAAHDIFRMYIHIWSSLLLPYSDRARAEVADACDLARHFSGAAGVFSLFGLQQIPDPHLALANWVKALCPGTVLLQIFLLTIFSGVGHRDPSKQTAKKQLVQSIIWFGELVIPRLPSLSVHCIPVWLE